MSIFNNILIVEDTPNLRQDLKRIIKLNNKNRRIKTAQNEIQALRLIKYNEFDVVVTDIKLDEAGGKETGGLDVLKTALEKNKNTRVIVVTAFGKMEVIDDETEDFKFILLLFS